MIINWRPVGQIQSTQQSNRPPTDSRIERKYFVVPSVLTKYKQLNNNVGQTELVMYIIHRVVVIAHTYVIELGTERK